MKPNKRKSNLFIGIAIIMILVSAYNAKAAFSNVGQLSSSSVTTTISVDFRPDALFRKLRNFISIDEIPIFNPREMINNTFSGFNDGIRDITGVDIIKLFVFVAGLFSKAFSWLTQLLQNIKS